jgi:hypothetical protein
VAGVETTIMSTSFRSSIFRKFWCRSGVPAVSTLGEPGVADLGDAGDRNIGLGQKSRR